MDRNRLLISLGILILLVLGGGFAFYFIIIAQPSGQQASTVATPGSSVLPKVGDSASPFNKYPTDFRAGSAATGTQGVAVVGTSQAAAPQDIGALRIISTNQTGPTPMTGAITLLKGKSAETARYVERGTGNIYEADLVAGTSSRLTLTTIPRVTESVWTPDGKGVYLRFIADSSTLASGDESITTLFADLSTLGATTTDADITTSPLAQDISGIAAQGKNAFLLGSNVSGAFGILQDIASKKKGTTVWRSPLAEWNIAWPKTNIVALTTKPSANAPGFLYFLDPSAQTASIELQNVPGLSALVSPDGSKILYSDTQNGLLETKILTVATGKTDDFPEATLADKCVWSAKEKTVVYCAVPQAAFGNIPDDWYKGTLSFDDQIWKIDLKTGTATTILAADPKNPLDMENLMLSPNEDYLVFTNKTNLMLWALRMK